tara:strand:- start:71 stop:499 length:429 start_codon:yes stop_codon:yes gene_type:complete
MVFYEFNYEEFPNIKLIFNNDVNNKELAIMFDEWLDIYKRSKDFNIIFDITKIKSPTVYFAYKMAKFISILREQTPQHYKNSIVIAPNTRSMKFILNFTFKITTPVSKVYIYWKEEKEDVNVDNILDIFRTNMFKFKYIPNK